MLLTGFLSSGASCGDGQEPRCSKGSRRGQGMQRCPPASWEETPGYGQAVTGVWSVVVTANYLNENRALVSSFFEQLSVLGTRMQKEHHGSSNSLCWNIPTAVSSSGGLCQCYGWSSNWLLPFLWENAQLCDQCPTLQQLPFRTTAKGELLNKHVLMALLPRQEDSKIYPMYFLLL